MKTRIFFSPQENLDHRKLYFFPFSVIIMKFIVIKSLDDTQIPSKEARRKVVSYSLEVWVVTAQDLGHPIHFTNQANRQEIFFEKICEFVMWH